MRTPIIAANWKMNTTVEEGRDLVQALLPRIARQAGVERVICPPFTHLASLAPLMSGSTVRLGAQNAYWEPKGAFTGEISLSMLLPLVEYVIIGHSERRQYFGETDETVARRLAAVLAAGLKPIMCIGETGPERERHETHAVLRRQLTGGLQGVEVGPEFVVAYEPVWAIGTGVAATPDDAQEACAFIRSHLRSEYGDVAEATRIQYGGSVNAKNALEILSRPDVDGALVGGASLDADGFAAIVSAGAEASSKAG